jgi:BrnA antitoxin of type II toxin-antitoxin system
MGKGMNKQYDFSQGKRGAVVPLSPGKTRITIRLDKEIIEWFRDRVDARSGGSYQTMINSALREHVLRGGEPLESWLRRVIREELQNKNSGNRARPIF